MCLSAYKHIGFGVYAFMCLRYDLIRGGLDKNGTPKHSSRIIANKSMAENKSISVQ
jgi:hypothetical protein